MEYLQNFFSWIWGNLRILLVFVINLLPDSPFSVLDNSAVAGYIGYLNWIIPIESMVAILQVWTVAIASFYVLQAILRWVKAIE